MTATVRESITADDIQDQIEFSEETFGPGTRQQGVIDHIRKELVEVEESRGDLKEWIDVLILAIDGAWRSGATPEDICTAYHLKMAVNKARSWPDWRTADPNQAIEHIR